MIFPSLKRIRDLEEKVEKLDREFRRMQLDWDDVLLKLRERNARMAATVKRLSEAEEPESAPDAHPDSPAMGLTARRAKLNADILARRARLSRETPQ